MGWTVTGVNHAVFSKWYELKQNGTLRNQGLNEECVWDYAPDYCTDPAASLEVQTKAIEVNEANYFSQLLSLKGIPTSHSILDAFRAIACANPRERAEAAYMTIQAVK